MNANDGDGLQVIDHAPVLTDDDADATVGSGADDEEFCDAAEIDDDLSAWEDDDDDDDFEDDEEDDDEDDDEEEEGDDFE